MMDVANMLSHEPSRPLRSQQTVDHPQQESQRSHQYPTRHSVLSNTYQSEHHQPVTGDVDQSSENFSSGANYSVPQTPHSPKNVAFELLFDDRTNYRARLPMRVQIFPHDTTDSIVTTVKNFYGLYEGTAKGVSFEDEQGNILIARYENFRNEMIVYVRVIPDYSQNWQPNEQAPSHAATPTSVQRTPQLDMGFEMPPPQPAQILTYGQPLSRPPSRIARKQSVSPGLGSNRRSASVQKAKPRSGVRSREESFQTQLDERNNDALREYSSSDGEGGSVTSSRKARNEQLASAEISLENIVEGGRRQRAKFESSELPLFVPPQVPATNSISSISPQRRSNGQDNPSPFARPAQRSVIQYQPLPSPQSYGFVESPSKVSPASASVSTTQPGFQHNHRLRDRVSAPGPLTRLSSGLQPRTQSSGILPTPDPTIASCISDEDVALQLMRLGDASNFSAHGRTSTSTQDDTLSGRADIASSATSDSEGDESDGEPFPQHDLSTAMHTEQSSRKAKTQIRHHGPNLGSAEASVDEDEDYEDGHIDVAEEMAHPAKRAKLSASKNGSNNSTKVRSQPASKKTARAPRSQQILGSKKPKPSLLNTSSKTAMSPPSLIPQSRKTSAASIASHPNQAGGDDDLSTKPRCQRCRKSKKGCDRQRPCQRCKDAGIGIEGCISEDEGNGRKGRFGRHMGVSVKKEHSGPTTPVETEQIDAVFDGFNGAQDKSKKRKRL